MEKGGKVIRVWVDDERPMPEDYDYAMATVFDTIYLLGHFWGKDEDKILLDLDHDAGQYATEGGDYIKILEFLEHNVYLKPKIYVKFHSMNPVGIKNMRRIVKNCSWLEEAK